MFVCAVAPLVSCVRSRDPLAWHRMAARRRSRSLIASLKTPTSVANVLVGRSSGSPATACTTAWAAAKLLCTLRTLLVNALPCVAHGPYVNYIAGVADMCM